jgi:periplasmic divalent cation tolerance protein
MMTDGGGNGRIVVLVTAPDMGVASRIAQALVEERLAACVNLSSGVRSIYRWDGKIADESETLMLIKTRQERFAALASRVKALHPYKVVEIVALPIAAGHEAYLKWIDSETTQAETKEAPKEPTKA